MATHDIEIVIVAQDEASKVISDINQRLANTGKAAAVSNSQFAGLSQQLSVLRSGAHTAVMSLMRFDIIPGPVATVTSAVIGLADALKGLLAHPIMLVAAAFIASGAAALGMVKHAKDVEKALKEMADEAEKSAAKTKESMLEITLAQMNAEQRRHRENSKEWLAIEKEKQAVIRDLTKEKEVLSQSSFENLLKISEAEKLSVAKSAKEERAIRRDHINYELEDLAKREKRGEDVSSRQTQLALELTAIEKNEISERRKSLQDAEDFQIKLAEEEKTLRATTELEKLQIIKESIAAEKILLEERAAAGYDVTERLRALREKELKNDISIEKEKENLTMARINRAHDLEASAIRQQAEALTARRAREYEEQKSFDEASWMAAAQKWDYTQGNYDNEKRIALETLAVKEEILAQESIWMEEGTGEWERNMSERAELHRQMTDTVIAYEEERIQKTFEMVSSAIPALEEAYIGYLNAKDESNKRQLDKEYAAQEKAFKQEALRQKERIGNTADSANRRAAIEDTLQSNLIALEEEKAARIDALNRQINDRNKLFRIMQITADAAGAVIKAYAELGPIGGLIFSAVIGGTAALSIATIMSQEYQADRGESKVVPGPRTMAVPAIVHGGEVIGRSAGPTSGITIVVEGNVFDMDDTMDRIGRGLYDRSKATGQRTFWEAS